MSRTLIIAPNWIGDAVMSEPLLRKLSSSGGELSVLATPWVAPVYRAMLNIEQVIEADFSHGKLELSLRLAIAKQLKKEAFQQVFVLPNSWKSILIPLLAKIPKIFAYKGEFRSPLLSEFLPNPPKKNRPPMVAHYLHLAHLIGLHDDDSGAHLLQPRLQVNSLEQQNALNVISSFPQPNFYVLAPGAEFGPAKQWPSKHFSELANQLLNHDPDSCVVLMGSSKDRGICDEIIQNTYSSLHVRMINLCGLVSLDQSIALIPQAKGLASNDSGMMHIAAAFGIPQIAFYGSSDPKHTPPLSPYAEILFLGLDCSPCHQRKCPLGHLNCLNQITPQSAYIELNRCITLRNTH
jgi:heptosyltransferase-2